MNPYLIPLLVCCSAFGAVVTLLALEGVKIGKWIYRRRKNGNM